MKFLENTFNISQFFKPCLDLEKEDKVKVEENEVLKISGEKSNKHIRVEEINCNKLKEATVSSCVVSNYQCLYSDSFIRKG